MVFVELMSNDNDPPVRTLNLKFSDEKMKTSIDVLPSKNQAPCKYCTHVSKLKHC